MAKFMVDCETCEHPWHGLLCDISTKYPLPKGGFVTGKCKCHGPYGAPVLNEGEKTTSTKGVW